MKRWLRVQENTAGEWSVTDLMRGYRVCAYNEDAHQGVHVHHPIKDGDTRPTRIEDRREAEAVVRLYASEHEWFTWKTFEECVERWRSESRNG